MMVRAKVLAGMAALVMLAGGGAAAWGQAQTQTWNVGAGTNAGGITSVKATLSDSTLTISGTGAMNNFGMSGGGHGPWSDYYRGSIINVIIESGVTSIGSNSFRDCSKLASITIPNSVTYIGSYAFENCWNLNSITIPSGVTSIEESTFEGCSKFVSITIPNSVTSIGPNAFNYCDNLASITIPNSVTSIGKGAFFQCSSLTSITIPSGVTTIGEQAFAYCTGLTSITNLNHTPPTLGANVFQNVDVTKVSLNVPTPTAYRDANVWKNFGNISALSWNIGVGADSTKVTAVVEDGVLTVSGTGRMRDGIPFGTSHPWYDFRDGIKSVIIKDGVTHIGRRSFYEHENVTSVTIPQSVTTIGPYAFYGMTGLTSITIPSGVTSIEESTFEDCTNLASITVLNPTPPTLWGTGHFQNVDIADVVLYVPSSAAVAAYKDATTWKNFGDIIPLTTISILTANREIPQADFSEEAVVIVAGNQQAGEFTAGPNIVDKNSNGVIIYRNGKRVDKGVLTVYNSLGSAVNKIKISENYGMNQKVLSNHSDMNSAKRPVGSWDLRDNKKRLVSEGTYLIRGTVVVDGKKEKVSLLVNVR